MKNIKKDVLFSSKKNRSNLSQSPNEIIKEIYSSGFVRDKNDNRTDELVGSAIPFDEGMSLFSWISNTKPKRTLEIGMAYGLSTLFICQAHQNNGDDGFHVAIDPEQSSVFGSIGFLNMQRANLDSRLKFYEEPSYKILPQLLAEHNPFDLIFIDGMHVFDYALVDFFYSDLLLKVGGYIVMDDIWMPSIRKAMMYVLRNRQYRIEPRMFWNLAPFPRRFWSYVAHNGRKRRLVMNVRQFIENPFDLLTFFYLTYFSIRGGLKFWGLQKIADDSRQWDFHRAF